VSKWPVTEEKISCKVRIKGHDKDYEGLAHVVHVLYRNKIDFWFGALEIAVSLDPLEDPEFLGVPLEIIADDGRKGGATAYHLEGKIDADNGEYFLLYFAGTTHFA